MTTRTAGPMPRDRYDLVALVARAAGVGLALALPLLALGTLRLLAPVMLDPAGTSGWAVPVGTGSVAALSALAAVPALAWVIRSGRLAGATAGSGWLALGATLAATALVGTAATTTFPGPVMAIGVVAAATGALATALLGRVRIDGAGRWWAALGLPAIAELALVAALLTPTSSEVMAAAPWIFAIGATLAVAAGAVTAFRGANGASHWLLAEAAVILALARPGSVDGLIGLAVLAIVPPLGLVALLGIARSTPAVAAAVDEVSYLEKERLLREIEALTVDLTDARRTIDLQRTEIERTAVVDPLTSVASRAATMDRLRAEVAEARRYPHPVTLVLVDVDGMGGINAWMGTSVGDEILREMALRMRVRIREADALGRIDGDAFLAILPHTDGAGAATFAEVIRDRAVARPIRTSAGEVTIRVSVGVALMRPGMDLTADALLARADEALASAQAAGGNVIAFDRLHGLARLEDRGSEDEPEAPQPTAVPQDDATT